MPVPEVNDKFNYGGVSFYRKQVAEMQYKNGIYDVRLINGQRIVYKKQDGAASVDASWNDNSKACLEIRKLKNASIFGNPEGSDYIKMYDNCYQNVVYLDNDKDNSGNHDWVTIGRDTQSQNIVVLDETDKAKFVIDRNCPDYKPKLITGPTTVSQEQFRAQF